MPKRSTIAKTIGQVLWDDLNFEREFAFIPRDTYATIPRGDVDRRRALRPLARAERRRPHHRHRAEDGAGVQVEMRLFNVRSRGSRVRQGVQRLGRESRGCTRTRSRTTFTSSSARCVAWRGRS